MSYGVSGEQIGRQVNPCDMGSPAPAGGSSRAGGIACGLIKRKRFTRRSSFQQPSPSGVLSPAYSFFLTYRTNSLIHDELLAHARAHFSTIVRARIWNAGYGGVYVEKKTGIASNPYLPSPDIRTTDGKTYTLRNPAIMTREISDLAGKGGSVTFRITSLKPLNPANVPDDFEQKALLQFEQGIAEFYREEVTDGTATFRYMAPLITEKTCLACHAEQGYREGDVRGGISVSFNVDAVRAKLRKNHILIGLFGAGTMTLLLAAVWGFTRRLINKLAGARRQIQAMAITDSLTGCYNRRHLVDRFMEEFVRARRLNRRLCVLMLDLDRFKSINDTRGHLTGDAVLCEVSRRIAVTVRMYDIAGRFGGEEFLVIVPDAKLEEARDLAERIRGVIRETPIEGVAVTASIGVAGMRSGDLSIEDIIRRADKALYAAKQQGRDRVAVEGLSEETV